MQDGLRYVEILNTLSLPVFDPNVNNEVVKPLRDFLPTYMCFTRKFTFFIV